MSDRGAARRPALVRLVPVALVGIAAIVTTYFIFDTGSPANSCVARVQLVVNASTEKADLLGEMAKKYNESNSVFAGNKCANVSVYKTTSGVAMEALAAGWNPDRDKAPVPQVWAPTSSLWLGLLRHQGKGELIRDPEPPSITTSVLAVAMPKEMADVLRANRGANLGWSDILDLSSKPGGWAEIPGGKPEWGRFTMARDDPHRSTSGLVATVASFHAAVQKVYGRSTITEADLGDSRVIQFVHGVESPVVRYSDNSTEFMGVLYDEDKANAPVPSISAIVVQEQLAFLYNKGAPRGDPSQLGKAAPPHRPLVAIHPSDGTLLLDHPYVVLANADPDQRAAADDFRAFLQRDDQQQRFMDFGFRDRNGNPSAALANAVYFDPNEKLSTFAPPSPDLLAQMVAAWDGARRNARVLLVLDVSGSMNNVADPTVVNGPAANKRRLDLVKPAAIKGIDLLSDQDEVGLWTFSSGSPQPYTEQVPLSPVGSVRQHLYDVINGLKAAGETALYRTTLAAEQKMLESLDPSRINAVVLLSDGEDNDRGNKDPKTKDIDALLSNIDAAKLESSVRIFTIPYGRDDGGRHVGVLAQIAAASKAASYDASNPLDIDKVFVDVFRNL